LHAALRTLNGVLNSPPCWLRAVAGGDIKSEISSETKGHENLYFCS